MILEGGLVLNLNRDCINEILMLVGTTPSESEIYPTDLPERFLAYSEDEVFYSVKHLIDKRLVKGSYVIGADNEWAFTPIEGLTALGRLRLRALRGN